MTTLHNTCRDEVRNRTPQFTLKRVNFARVPTYKKLKIK